MRTVTIAIAAGILILAGMLTVRDIMLTELYVRAGYQQGIIVTPASPSGHRVWVKPSAMPFQLGEVR